MENKKSKTGLHILGGILIGIIICIILGFILYSQDYITIKTSEVENNQVEENKEEEKEEEKTEDNTNENLGFDSSKITNGTGSYTLTVPSHATGINISLDETGTKVTLGVNMTLVNEAYALGWVTAAESYTYDPYELTFSQKVIDVFFGGIGQDATGDVILFLMEDGTVEYIPLKKALSEGISNLRSYGTLSGISDVVKFYQANSNGAVTVLAQTKDGILYDLNPIINNAQ